MLLVRRRARLIYAVTEGFREELCSALTRRMAQLGAAAQAMAAAIEQSSEEEAARAGGLVERRDRTLKSRDAAAARLAQVQGMSPGSEVAEGIVEIVSEIRAGDSAERLRDAQIVISDGRILEIRNP